MTGPRHRRPSAKDANASSQQDESSSSSSPPLLSPQADRRSSQDAALLWTALLLVIMQASYFVYYFQCLKLPSPVPAAQAGKRGFSEERAYQHVRFLSSLGPHPVGSDALDTAIEYVMSQAEEIEAAAAWDVDVDVDLFHAKPGVNNLEGGLFKGKSLVYANLKHVVVRVKPKSLSTAAENAILISSHIDTVITSPGAGDCSSNVAVMLELLRAISHWGHGFKHSVIFLFNTGEEEGLDGAHGFITQHPWRSSIRTFMDLEAMGIGGKSTLFQGGPNKRIVELCAKEMKYPAAQIAAQDVFLSGFVKSATDFQVYQEVANLSGLDFAFMRNGAVYHTKNDKIQLLTPGSLQHLGDNILAVLLGLAVSDELSQLSVRSTEVESKMGIVYFDILGKYLITYSQEFAKQLHASVIAQALLLLLMSLYQGGLASVTAMAISIISLILMWAFSISLSALVGFVLPRFSSAAIPYIPHPWLAIGLFGAPALIGALLGHFLGYMLLKGYLIKVRGKSSGMTNISPKQSNLSLAVWDTERWLFKVGFLQWLLLLAAGTWLEVGSSYIAILWLVSPALAYGLIDATFSPQRAPRELRSVTLLVALPVPLIATGGNVIQFFDIMVGNLVRFDRNPGATPEWLGNLFIAVLAAMIVCLFLVYLLPYVYRSGGIWWILSGLSFIFIATLLVVSLELLPPFTNHFGRAVNVAEIVKVGSTADEGKTSASSYVSISSFTPGKLGKESSFLEDEGFVCGEIEDLDMVTHKIKYGCTSSTDLQGYKDSYMSELPTVVATGENVGKNERETKVLINTGAARRWVLAINAMEVNHFQLAASKHAKGENEILAPRRAATSTDGWHLIQFVTDKTGPTHFELTLYSNSTLLSSTDRDRHIEEKLEKTLLKLRTDVDRLTPGVERALLKLPGWIVTFGKSTAPYPLSYLVTVSSDVAVSG